MTLLLGVVALLQAVILPGYLFVRRFVGQDGFIRGTILIICLSLMLNHLIVYLLTAAHFYNRVSLLMVLSLEVFFLVKQKARESATASVLDYSGDLLRFKAAWLEATTGSFWQQLFRRLIIAAALMTLVYFAFRVVHGFATIFNQWDDVVSWNKWAVDWYRGRFPTHTWHYPQLLPSVWSITYQAIGSSDIQFFAKGIMGLFPLLLLMAMFDLWLRCKSTGYLAGIPITAFLLLFANGVNVVGSGYADVPVALMAFVPVYLLLTADDEYNRDSMLFAGSMIAAAAALTKQAGLYLLVLYPLVSFYLTPAAVRRSKEFFKRSAACFTLSVVLVLPWYVHTEFAIRKGNEQSEIKLVTADMHQGKGLLARVAEVPRKVEQQVKNSPRLEQLATILGASFLDGSKVTNAFLLTIFVFAAASLREPLWRVPVLLVMLPFTSLWLALYSYDFRNLSLVLPYIGAGAGLTVVRYGESLFKRLPVFRPSTAACMIIAAVLLACSGFVLDRDYLLSRQHRLLRDIGTPEVNRMIYSLATEHEAGKIITNYHPVQYLPGIENKYLNAGFDNEAQIAGLIASGDYKYLLVFQSGMTPSAAVRSLLLGLVKTGRLEQLTSPCSGYDLLRVKK